MSKAPAAPRLTLRQKQSRQHAAMLEREISRAQSRIQTVDLLSALMTVAAALLCYLLVVMSLDMWLQLPDWLRTTLFAAAVAGGMGYLAWAALRPMLMKVNPYFAARRLEQSAPGSKNGLVNWLDLRDERLNAVIQDALQKNAVAELDKADVEEAIPTRRPFRLGLLAGLLIFAMFLFFLILPNHVGSLMMRALLPFRSTAIPTHTRIELIRPVEDPVSHTPTTDEVRIIEVPPGEPVSFAALVHGVVPDDVWLEYQPTLQEKPVRKALARPKDDAQREPWSFTLPGDAIPAEGLWFRLRAGDGQTRQYRLVVSARRPPTLSEVELTLKFPEYSGRRDAKQNFAPIRALLGTQVSLELVADQPVKEGSLYIKVKSPEDQRVRLLEPMRLKLAGPNSNGESDPRRLVLEQPLALTKELRGGAVYYLSLVNLEGKSGDSPEYVIEIEDDKVPIVKLLSLGEQQFDLDKLPDRVTLAANAVVPLEGKVWDDVAVQDIRLRLRHKDGPELGVFGTKPKETSVQKATGFVPPPADFQLTLDLTKLTETPLPAGQAPAPGQYLKLRGGQMLELWVEASDGAKPEANVGRSSLLVIELTEPQEQQKRQEQEQKAQDKEKQAEQKKQDREKKEQEQQQQQQNQEQQPKDQADKKQGEKGKEGDQKEDGKESNDPKDGKSGEKQDSKPGKEGKSGESKDQPSGKDGQPQEKNSSEDKGGQPEQKQPGKDQQPGKDSQPDGKDPNKADPKDGSKQDSKDQPKDAKQEGKPSPDAKGSPDKKQDQQPGKPDGKEGSESKSDPKDGASKADSKPGDKDQPQKGTDPKSGKDQPKDGGKPDAKDMPPKPGEKQDPKSNPDKNAKNQKGGKPEDQPKGGKQDQPTGGKDEKQPDSKMNDQPGGDKNQPKPDDKNQPGKPGGKEESKDKKQDKGQDKSQPNAGQGEEKKDEPSKKEGDKEGMDKKPGEEKDQKPGDAKEQKPGDKKDPGQKGDKNGEKPQDGQDKKPGEEKGKEGEKEGDKKAPDGKGMKGEQPEAKPGDDKQPGEKGKEGDKPDQKPGAGKDQPKEQGKDKQPGGDKNSSQPQKPENEEPKGKDGAPKPGQPEGKEGDQGQPKEQPGKAEKEPGKDQKPGKGEVNEMRPKAEGEGNEKSQKPGDKPSADKKPGQEPKGNEPEGSDKEGDKGKEKDGDKKAGDKPGDKEGDKKEGGQEKPGPGKDPAGDGKDPSKPDGKEGGEKGDQKADGKPGDKPGDKGEKGDKPGDQSGGEGGDSDKQKKLDDLTKAAKNNKGKAGTGGGGLGEELPTPDTADSDAAKKATDLMLEDLRKQLDSGKIDKRLEKTLEEAKLTPEEAKELLKDADRIRSKTAGRTQGPSRSEQEMRKNATLNRDSRYQPPPELESAYRRFTEQRAKQSQGSPGAAPKN